MSEKKNVETDSSVDLENDNKGDAGDSNNPPDTNKGSRYVDKKNTEPPNLLSRAAAGNGTSEHSGRSLRVTNKEKPPEAKRSRSCLSDSSKSSSSDGYSDDSMDGSEDSRDSEEHIK